MSFVFSSKDQIHSFILFLFRATEVDYQIKSEVSKCFINHVSVPKVKVKIQII